MENKDSLEVRLFSKSTLGHSNQKQLAAWFATNVQSVVRRQYERTRKKMLRVLRETPPICMS
jgi:hypothetical protein